MPPNQGQPGMPPQGGMPPPMGGMPPMGGGMGAPTGFVSERTHIEEIAEAIIDEKWEELIKNLNKISEWRDQTENKISRIEQQFADLKDNFDKLHKAIIGKIGEYDQNIINVATEIKAMEKVFQKILPTFTENVNELARITTLTKEKMDPNYNIRPGPQQHQAERRL
jgi:septation ring formation regulator EzrA